MKDYEKTECHQVGDYTIEVWRCNVYPADHWGYVKRHGGIDQPALVMVHDAEDAAKMVKTLKGAALHELEHGPIQFEQEEE